MSLDGLADAILDCAVTLQVTRFYPPEVRNGRVQSAPREKVFSIKGSMQPMKGRELQTLPEGLRTQGVAKLYTQEPLFTVRTSECDLPDHVLYRDVTYVVTEVDDWDELGGYHKVLLVRRER